MAVVGGGPAGLTCAYFLALMGRRSVVFEALPIPGRHARGGHPRVPAAQDATCRPTSTSSSRHGVELRTGSRVDDAGALCRPPASRRSSWPPAPTAAGRWASRARTSRAWWIPWRSSARRALGAGGAVRQAGRRDRRRQRGHRRRPLRPAPGRLEGAHPVPPHARGDARLRGGDRGRAGGGRGAGAAGGPGAHPRPRRQGGRHRDAAHAPRRGGRVRTAAPGAGRRQRVRRRVRHGHPRHRPASLLGARSGAGRAERPGRHRGGPGHRGHLRRRGVRRRGLRHRRRPRSSRPSRRASAPPWPSTGSWAAAGCCRRTWA